MREYIVTLAVRVRAANVRDAAKRARTFADRTDALRVRVWHCCAGTCECQRAAPCSLEAGHPGPLCSCGPRCGL